jgi:aminomethyltransferase
MVDLERRGWIGRDALAAEARAGSRWRLVRVELDAEALEELFHAEGLAPCTPDGAWRDPVPMYAGGEQVGWATSGAFSPLLKRHLAIATVDAARAGSDLRMEVTVDHRRRSVPVRVSGGPLLDPSRRTAS